MSFSRPARSVVRSMPSYAASCWAFSTSPEAQRTRLSEKLGQTWTRAPATNDSCETSDGAPEGVPFAFWLPFRRDRVLRVPAIETASRWRLPSPESASGCRSVEHSKILRAHRGPGPLTAPGPMFLRNRPIARTWIVGGRHWRDTRPANRRHVASENTSDPAPAGSLAAMAPTDLDLDRDYRAVFLSINSIR